MKFVRLVCLYVIICFVSEGLSQCHDGMIGRPFPCRGSSSNCIVPIQDAIRVCADNAPRCQYIGQTTGWMFNQNGDVAELFTGPLNPNFEWITCTSASFAQQCEPQRHGRELAQVDARNATAACKSHENCFYIGRCTAHPWLRDNPNQVQLFDSNPPYYNSEWTACSLPIRAINFELQMNRLRELYAGPRSLRSQTVTNETPDPMSSTLTLEETTEKTSTWSRTNGFEIKVTTSFSAGVPFIAQANWSVEASTSHEWTNGETDRTEYKFSQTHTCTIAPYSRVMFELISWTGEAEVPWQATIHFEDVTRTMSTSGIWTGISWGRDEVLCRTLRDYKKLVRTELMGSLVIRKSEHSKTVPECEAECTENATECLGFTRSSEFKEAEKGDCVYFTVSSGEMLKRASSDRHTWVSSACQVALL